MHLCTATMGNGESVEIRPGELQISDLLQNFSIASSSSSSSSLNRSPSNQQDPVYTPHNDKKGYPSSSGVNSKFSSSSSSISPASSSSHHISPHRSSARISVRKRMIERKRKEKDTRKRKKTEKRRISYFPCSSIALSRLLLRHA